MSFLHCLFLLFIAAAAVGCATTADLQRVRREQQEMRALLADTQVSVDQMNRRLDTMQSETRGVPSDEMTKIDRRMMEIERRVATIEAGAVTGVAVAGAEVQTVAGSGPARRTQAATVALQREEARLQSGNVDQAYREGIELYRDGQATQAIEKFRQFIRRASKSDLSDNAQYWIGESYYNLQDYNRAILELNEVLLKYPQGDQVPGALLALATAFADSGDKIDARLILQKLISDHPDTEEAKLGQNQLEKLTE
jgi:tol-pal system protein YbgF